jgi:preprotein translocase subunit YajC
MSFLLSDAYAAAEAGANMVGQRAEGSFSLLMIVGIFVLFYFMMIRPQNKRAKQHKELITKLQKGDEIVLTSGILAKVEKLLSDTHIKVSLNNDVEVIILRDAVTSVLPKGTIGSL